KTTKKKKKQFQLMSLLLRQPKSLKSGSIYLTEPPLRGGEGTIWTHFLQDGLLKTVHLPSTQNSVWNKITLEERILYMPRKNSIISNCTWSGKFLLVETVVYSIT